MMETPTFTIIIPTYNRTTGLTDCLGAVAALDYPRSRFEVIVVDDGSRPPAKTGRGLADENLQIRIIRQENAGPAKARNRGAKEARGEFLAFTDDDCMPESKWLRTLAEQLIKTPGCGVGGRTINALTDNLCPEASQLLVDYLYEYYNGIPDQAALLTSNNMAVEKKRFFEIGFDETFPLAGGEDREFCAQWTHNGYRLIHVPEARVYHRHPMTLIDFWRQHFRYGQGAYLFHRRTIARRSGRVRLEPISFYLRLLGYPLRKNLLQTGSRRTLITALFGLSQMANSAGYLNKWGKRL